MSWKHAKASLLALTPWSLTKRLTLFYTLSSVLITLSMGIYLFLSLTHILHRTDEQLLADDVRKVKNILISDPHNLAALSLQVVTIPKMLAKSPRSIYHYYLRVMDQNSKVVLSTEKMDSALKGEDFFAKKFIITDKAFSRWQSPEGKEYLLMQTGTKSVDNRGWLLQAALDVSHQSKMMGKYRRQLVIVVLFAMFFAILLGYYITHRGMRRLYELTEATKNITAKSLHQRIRPELWPRELSQLGMAFNSMLNRVEDSFKKLTAFSADLAHELRTPINNLMGELEVALSRKPSNEEYHRILESNLEELQRLAQIIESLLFLARAENPQLDLKKEKILIESVVKLICDYYQPLAEENKIKLSYTGHASCAVNPQMFQQLINNILSNALKYTLPGGSVRFVISETPKEAEIRLQDSGIGMAEEHQAKVFDRFYRIDSARSQHSGGFGLGLAIVKSIVELHQGKIKLKSVINQGTEIIITLPK